MFSRFYYYRPLSNTVRTVSILRIYLSLGLVRVEVAYGFLRQGENIHNVVLNGSFYMKIIIDKH